MMVLFFTHIPFVVNHTFNAIPPERFQQLHKSGISSKAINETLLHKPDN